MKNLIISAVLTLTAFTVNASELYVTDWFTGKAIPFSASSTDHVVSFKDLQRMGACKNDALLKEMANDPINWRIISLSGNSSKNDSGVGDKFYKNLTKDKQNSIRSIKSDLNKKYGKRFARGCGRVALKTREKFANQKSMRQFRTSKSFNSSFMQRSSYKASVIYKQVSKIATNSKTVRVVVRAGAGAGAAIIAIPGVTVVTTTITIAGVIYTVYEISHFIAPEETDAAVAAVVKYTSDAYGASSVYVVGVSEDAAGYVINMADTTTVYVVETSGAVADYFIEWFDDLKFDLPDFNFNVPEFDLPDFNFNVPEFDIPDFNFDVIDFEFDFYK